MLGVRRARYSCCGASSCLKLELLTEATFQSTAVTAESVTRCRYLVRFSFRLYTIPYLGIRIAEVQSPVTLSQVIAKPLILSPRVFKLTFGATTALPNILSIVVFFHTLHQACQWLLISVFAALGALSAQMVGHSVRLSINAPSFQPPPPSQPNQLLQRNQW